MPSWTLVLPDSHVVSVLSLVSAAITVTMFCFEPTRRVAKWAIVVAIVLLAAFASGGLGGVKRQQASPPVDAQPASSVVPAHALRQEFDDSFALAANGFYREACSGFEEIGRVAPDYPTLHAQKAFCLRQMGRLQEALLEAKGAVREVKAAGGREGAFRTGNAEYMVAVIEFALGGAQDAMDALRAAKADGFPWGCDLQKDGDFVALKADSRFTALAESMNGRLQCFK